MPITISTLTFAAALFLCTHLTRQILTPPNPPPAKTWKHDVFTSFRSHDTLRNLYVLAITTAYLTHITLVLLPFPPPTRICPNATTLSTYLFIWSPYSFVCILAILIAAPIRLLAYHQLGADFTFQLGKPKRLFTGGVYAYVQHPSYSTLWVVNVAAAALLGRFRGVMGCWVGEGVLGVEIEIVGLVVFAVVAAALMGVRVRQEEEMLRVTFGREWEVWHERTSRFVPGVW